MLRLPISYYLVLLWPDKIELVKASWPLKRNLAIEDCINLPPNISMESSIEQLVKLISKLNKWQVVTIVLFGQKTRYRLLEHDLNLSPAEFSAFAEHQFKQILGNKNVYWKYFTEKIRPARKNLILAIDSLWLDHIQKATRLSGLLFVSIQPAASWLLNNYKRQLNGSDWKVIDAEKDIFLFKLAQGELEHLKHTPLTTHSLSLENLLEREMIAMGDSIQTASCDTYSLYDLFGIPKRE